MQRGGGSPVEIDEQVRPFLDGAEQTTQPIVDDLIARGWLKDDDGRVALTPTGAQMLTTLLDEVSTSRQVLMAGIAPQDYALAVSVLEQMARNFGWSQQD